MNDLNRMYKNQINVIKTLAPLYNLKDEEDIKYFLPLAKKCKNNILRVVSPELKSVFSIKITNLRSAEEVLKRLVSITNQRIEEPEKKLSFNDVKSGFYNFYGIITKSLMVSNVAVVVGAGLSHLPVFTIMASLLFTVILVINASVNDVPLSSAYRNLKTSIEEFVKNKLPTKREKNLAYKPLVFLGFTLILLVVELLMLTFPFSFFISSRSLEIIKIISFLPFFFAIFYYIADLADEWILRKGFREAP